MLVSNLHISKTLRYVPLVLALVVVIDILFLFIPGFFGGLELNGYVAIAIPVLAIAFYSYIGFPLFTFNSTTDVIKIKSHMALSRFFGKSLTIPKMNITNLEIDLSGVRKKLTVTFINRYGKEVSETFSISILSRKRLKMLEAAVDNIQREKSPKNLHLFI